MKFPILGTLALMSLCALGRAADIYVSVTSTAIPGAPGQSYGQLQVNYTSAPLTRTSAPHLSLSNFVGKGTITYDSSGRGISYVLSGTSPSYHVYAKPKLVYMDGTFGIFLTTYECRSSTTAVDANYYVGKGRVTHGANYAVELNPDTTVALQNIGLRQNRTIGYIGGVPQRTIYSYNYYIGSSIPSGWIDMGKGRISGAWSQQALHVVSAPLVMNPSQFKQQFTAGMAANGISPFSVYSGNYYLSVTPSWLFHNAYSRTNAYSSNLYVGKGYLDGDGLTVTYLPAASN